MLQYCFPVTAFVSFAIVSVLASTRNPETLGFLSRRTHLVSTPPSSPSIDSNSMSLTRNSSRVSGITDAEMSFPFSDQAISHKEPFLLTVVIVVQDSDFVGAEVKVSDGIPGSLHQQSIRRLEHDGMSADFRRV